MNTGSLIPLRNAQAVKLDDVPHVNITDFLAAIWENTRAGGRISALFGTHDEGGQTRLFSILSNDEHGSLACVSASVHDRYPSLTPDCPQAHWFEREIAEQWGIIPEGHPWLKPIRFHHSYRNGHELWQRKPGEYIPLSVIDSFRMSREEMH